MCKKLNFSTLVGRRGEERRGEEGEGEGGVRALTTKLWHLSSW
jgi:hypothetical protein